MVYKDHFENKIAFDFDGVINSYTSGYQGITNIPDPPVEGIIELMEALYEKGWTIYIFSSRALTKEGEEAIWNYMSKYLDISIIEDVTPEKIIADIYVDDRAVQFNGDVDDLENQINNFEPWYYKDTDF